MRTGPSEIKTALYLPPLDLGDNPETIGGGQYPRGDNPWVVPGPAATPSTTDLGALGLPISGEA
jgi:hypothetical protein